MSFFHPDYTVGIGIAPIQPKLADYHRRSGITPCPEDVLFLSILSLNTMPVNQYDEKKIPAGILFT